MLLGVGLKDAYTNDVHHYYIARNCKKTTVQELDETEHIEIRLITIKQLFENALNGKMTDALAVLMAYKELKEIE